MRPLPLKWRISLGIAAALAAAVAAVFAVAYLEVREQVFRQVDRALASGAQAAAVVVDEGETPAAQAAQLQAVVGASLPKRASFCRIWTPGSGTDLHSWGLGDKGDLLRERLAGLSPPAPGQSIGFNLGRREDPYRAVWLLMQTRRGPVHIVVGQSTRPIEVELDELLRTFVTAGGGIVVGSGLLALLAVAWGLRPIGRTAAGLAQVTARNVGSVALDPAKPPAELRPFVQAVQDMLARLAEAMVREKAFVSDASHELRTPLALAKSTVQLALGKDRAPEEYRQALAGTLEDLRRMERLVDELLLLARLDDPAAGLPDETIALDHLLGEVCESFGPRASAAGGRLVSSLSPAAIRGDSGQIERLFSNLLDNALRHGPAGGTVQLAMESRPGEVVVRVQDDGGSIPPEALPRLFERFYRVDGSRASATGGAGLGLAIAREIAVRHGGIIGITSEKAPGTQVTVTLPLA